MLKRLSQFGLVLCLATGVAFGQKDKVPMPPKPDVKPKPYKAPKIPDPPDAFGGGDTTEKAIPADPDVAVKLCVGDGDVKINGSERNEVRVFVRNGRKFEFRSLDKNPDTGKANWVWLARAASQASAIGPNPDCLSGENIEIDMPLRGSLFIEGRSATVSVDSVTKATVKLVEGDISARNIPGGLIAYTNQGEMVVESVAGDIGLETTSGNIVAFDVKNSRPGESFKVKTNSGVISLQNVNHRQIDVNAFTGNIKFAGAFAQGGIYKFRSAEGRLEFLLPEKIDCKVSVSFGFGRFDPTSVPMKILTQTITDGGKSLVAAVGTGVGPLITLETTKGTIRLRRQGDVDLP